MSATAKTPALPVDAAGRERALDVARSFIVQAPAGSGKTGLLVQRFLALLARATRPEAVLAITFTRKAAGEMRRRIVESLREAAHRGEPPEADFERRGYELARAVLERDIAEGWGLLASPSRMQVFTIDGFCSRIVAGTPLLSRLGSTPRVVDDADVLYRDAVRRTLGASGRTMLGTSLELLLERYEMKIEQLETQLMAMLSCRDQWSGEVVAGHGDADAWVDGIEEAMHEALAAEVRSIAADFDPGWIARIHDIACRSRAAAAGEIAWPTLGGDERLGPEAPASTWKQAAALLLKDGKLRRPKGKHGDVWGDDAELKADMAGLLAEMDDVAGERRVRLLETLKALAKLASSPLFTESGRQALAAFLAVLRHCLAELWTVFRERGETDHVEVAMQAVAALDPRHGDTLERLDARLEHVLVDEFQDTNVLQCALLRFLTSGWQPQDGRTLFLVGDPMQSIYRFRKAEVGLFLGARSTPGFLGNVVLEPLGLSVNFRSGRRLIDWVNDVFARLLGDRDDATRSLVAHAKAAARPGAGDGEGVELLLWSEEKEDADPPGEAADAAVGDAAEARGLAQWIAARVARQREAKDRLEAPRAGSAPIAVLVRARSHALALLRALERDAPDVRVRAPGLDMLADRVSVMDLEALTRSLLHAGDRLSHLAMLRSPWVGLALEDIARLVEADVVDRGRRATPIPLLLGDAEALARVSSDARRRIGHWMVVADAARREAVARPLDIVVRSAWLRLGGPLHGTRTEALDAEAYFGLLAARAEGGSIDLDDLSRVLAATEASVDLDAAADVDIMTMHKAKGLEFDTVILPALGRTTGGGEQKPLAIETEPDTGLLRLVAPRGARGRKDADREKYDFLQHREKRRGEAEILRLLYVAATRAKRCLVLSACAARLNKAKPAKKGEPEETGAAKAGSLLGALAPALQTSAFTEALARSACAETATLSLRFPTGHRLGDVPASVEDRSVASESPSRAAELRPTWFADSKRAAHVGTVYHAMVEIVAAEGIDAWLPARVGEEAERIERLLRAEGVVREELAACIDAVSAALRTTLEDERGRWILGAHGEARSEWAVQEYAARRLTSAVIDRTFVVDGVRWIVDFKTGSPDLSRAAAAGEDVLATYISEKKAAYAAQLLRYRTLVEGAAAQSPAMTPGLPIRLGLFFPQLPAGSRWQEVVEEDAQGATPFDDPAS